jgi:molybdate transport system regulatory protein
VSAAPVLRARLWIEASGLAAMTEAGADLLEQILVTRSLSEAARRLRYSYRRAWMLVDAMNARWPHPLVKTAVGGKKGGGTQVTEYGRLVLRSYRDAQIQMELALDTAGRSFAAATKTSGVERINSPDSRRRSPR